VSAALRGSWDFVGLVRRAEAEWETFAASDLLRNANVHPVVAGENLSIQPTTNGVGPMRSGFGPEIPSLPPNLLCVVT
jgi:hypothetical protein